MATPRHLNHAPITEALVDMRVEPKQGLSFAEIQNVFTELNFGYYLKGVITRGMFEFRMTQEGIQSESGLPPEQVGLRLHSHDEKYVVQCGIEGFTVSRLPPYESWSKLVDEAHRVWTVYLDRLRPSKVVRVATRYINNLRLPLDQGGSFQAYLRKFADVPEEAPQAMTAFLQRFKLMDLQKNTNVNLTIALESTPIAQPVPVILDIDVFAHRQLNPEDKEIWRLLDSLREFKNQCFFGSLTDKAMELYE